MIGIGLAQLLADHPRVTGARCSDAVNSSVPVMAECAGQGNAVCVDRRFDDHRYCWEPCRNESELADQKRRAFMGQLDFRAFLRQNQV